MLLGNVPHHLQSKMKAFYSSLQLQPENTFRSQSHPLNPRSSQAPKCNRKASPNLRSFLHRITTKSKSRSRSFPQGQLATSSDLCAERSNCLPSSRLESMTARSTRNEVRRQVLDIAVHLESADGRRRAAMSSLILEELHYAEESQQI
uniref:Ovate family protein n=1 Tax=Steinernema glaseri TaxID=37863 RepID=A0A1I7ZDT7_9BILA